ncbi:helix-turn-helix domain-containing protein [Paenibacillus qinlingensis]|uniref:AraC family transcriptional regulator of arabinose operon n=1 Tax=Paenibacillus qinlingensis TaxID=1837343 RepID=A0ABU1NR52_9BACL|nr:helix-turn-helix domain-containing protein [Paenibacillus qinlingensis]MDR6549954.1 AraC family transcriptional regulator of arabinose operon [Paenibacillus qinlingensis]
MTDFISFSAKENLITIPGKLISGHYRQSYGYQVKRSNGTKDYYLTLTLQGIGLFNNGKETYPCQQNEVTIITPGTPHFYGTPENTLWEFYWCHFVPQKEWLPLLQLPEAIKGIRLARLGDDKELFRLRNAFAQLLQYNEEVNSFAERLAMNALEQILLLLSKSAMQTEYPLDSRVKLTLALIAEHYNQPYTVSDLAAAVNLSPSRFAHLFKTQTGESVMDMLNKTRLRQARKLIETTSLPMAEVAEEVGFNHPFYFSRQFSAFYGTSPAAFRKRIQQMRLE